MTRATASLATCACVALVLSSGPALARGPVGSAAGPAGATRPEQPVPDAERDAPRASTAPEARPSPATLRVELACPACEADADIAATLLWRTPRPGESRADTLVLRTVDWASGSFERAGDGVATPVEAEPVADGWAVEVPLDGRAWPFRVVVVGTGLATDGGADWPAARWLAGDGSPVRARLEPQQDVLDRHPAWDPARATECDLIVPKELEPPVVIFVGGRPRGWLTPAGADGAWRYQYVRPGRSLLERFEVLVTPSDEGEAWAFPVPLAPLVDGARVDAAASAGPREGPEPEIVLGDVGVLRLEDCPRTADEP